MNWLKAKYAALKDWLNAHPKVKAGIIVAEGAALGALGDAINAYQSGAHMSFKGTVSSIGIAVYIAVKNYVAVNAGWKKPQLPEGETKRP